MITMSKSLQVEAVGDFARGKVVPMIRVRGAWLERAGFPPGSRVAVEFEEQGAITLRVIQSGLHLPASEARKDPQFAAAIAKLTDAIKGADL